MSYPTSVNNHSSQIHPNSPGQENQCHKALSPFTSLIIQKQQAALKALSQLTSIKCTNAKLLHQFQTNVDLLRKQTAGKTISRSGIVLCKNSLSRLKEEMSVSTKTKCAIETTESLLNELDTISHYQEATQALSLACKQFFSKVDKDPLNAFNELTHLLTTLAKLDESIDNLPHGEHFFKHLHEIQKNEIYKEISHWKIKVEKQLDTHIEHLSYLHKNPSLKEQANAKIQLSVLALHLKSIISQLQNYQQIPIEFEASFDSLKSSLTLRLKECEKFGKLDAKWVSYGSKEWLSLVANRPPLPKGIKRFIFSLANNSQSILKTIKKVAVVALIAFAATRLPYGTNHFPSGPSANNTSLNEPSRELPTGLTNSSLWQPSPSFTPPPGINNFFNFTPMPENLTPSSPNLPQFINITEPKEPQCPTIQPSPLFDVVITPITPKISPRHPILTHTNSSVVTPITPQPLYVHPNLSKITPISNITQPIIRGLSVLPLKDDLPICTKSEALHLLQQSTNTLQFLLKSTEDNEDLRKEVLALLKQSNLLEMQLETCDNDTSTFIKDLYELQSKISQLKIKIQANKEICKPEEVTPYIPQRAENCDLVKETLEQMTEIPSDEDYANLAGLYRPEIHGTIDDIALAGLAADRGIAIFLDTQRAYLKALNSHPTFSSGCRQEPCHIGFDTQESDDLSVIKKSIEKSELALRLFHLQGLNKERAIQSKFNSITPGESFFLPVKTLANPSGHAMVLEIEKGVDEKIILRLFNIGRGIYNHAAVNSPYGTRHLPYTEVVNIDPKRFFGGAFSGLLSRVENQANPLNPEGWDEIAYYNVALASLGGEMSNRQEATDLFRDHQYMGNCPVASAAIALDKTFVSAGLAERMRALTLFRATKSYYQENFHRLVSGGESESRRRLLISGSKATLESIERAIETHGFIGKEAEELISQTKAIQQSVLKLQSEDQGALANSYFTFDSYTAWKMGGLQIDPAIIQPLPTTHSLGVSRQKTPAQNSTEIDPKIYPTALLRKKPATFTPNPIKNKLLDNLVQFAHKQKDLTLPVNRAAKLTPLDFDEIFQIGFQDSRGLTAAHATKSLKVTENIALAGQHLSDLLDDDRLNIVHQAMLNREFLEENLKKDPGLISSIERFCNKGRYLGHLLQKTETEGFFAYLSRTAEQVIRDVAIKLNLEVNLSALPNSRSIFKGMISDSDDITADKERLRIIHFYRMKSFEMHNQLTVEDAEELLTSVNFLKSHGFPANLTIDSSNELKKIADLIDLAQQHLQSQTNAHQILNEIARGVDPLHKPCEWEFIPSENAYINLEETLLYRVSTGILKKALYDKEEVPQALKDDLLFRRIVKDVDSKLDKIQDDAYAYTDEEGYNYRFSLVSGKAVVQRQYNDRWFQGVNPQGIITMPFSNGGKNPSWEEDGILWVSSDINKTFFKDRDVWYYTTPNNVTLQSAKEPSKGFFGGSKNLYAELVTSTFESTQLRLVDPTNTNLTKLISRVEIPSYTLSFTKEVHLEKVMLPRLGLTFEHSPTSNMLVCRQLDGYGICSGSQTHPLFGDFAHYLPLKKINGKEQFGAVIPYLPFLPQDASNLKTPTSFKWPANSWQTAVPYFFYRLKGDLLVPEVSSQKESIQANLHLATIFLSENRYEEAAKYLSITDKEIKSLGLFAGNEIIEPLKQLANFAKINNDLTPDAVAIRLKAVAMIQRLINLHQTPAIELNIDYDFIYYKRHINRVPISLRLSEEDANFVSDVLSPKENLPLASLYAFPIPSYQGKVSHKALTLSGKQDSIQVSTNIFQLQNTPTDAVSSGDIISSANPIFVMAFPEAILPLYRLLINPLDIGLSQRIKIARQFGLDPSIDVKDLKQSAITMLEMRYRYLVETLQFVSSSIQNTLQPEVNLLAALIQVAHGNVPAPANTENDVSKYHQLVTTLNTIPGYSSAISAYQDLTENITGDALKEALQLWALWVQPKVRPLPSSMEYSNHNNVPAIGPFITVPILNLQPKESSPDSFTHSYAASTKRPSLLCYSLPSAQSNSINKCFTKQAIPTTQAISPFTITPKDTYIADSFAQYDVDFHDFVAKKTKQSYQYTLIDKKGLKKECDGLKQDVKLSSQRADITHEILINQLNKKSNDININTHNTAQLARGVARELTFNDAKAALARNWDVNYLRKLNPNLSLTDINNIFETTLDVLLQRRDLQRKERLLKVMQATLDTDQSSQNWNIVVDDLMQATQEHLLYDPYDFPIFLIAETEYDIALWEEQIPAIKRLAPREQASVLVELAMALGKTDIISPTLLSIIADGQTLVIFVTTDALVPNAAPQLQKRMNKGFNSEIRTIPVDRGVWSANKINKLREEMERMIDQRVALIWSSLDIQTLINSYIEDNEESSVESVSESEHLQKMEAWQKLFDLLRNKAKIIGDEIHAILDILTSYNFSLGKAQPFDQDEMDATADFIKVFVTHPEVINKLNIPFLSEKGTTPLTEEYFNSIIAPKMVETLLKRGITGDKRNIELFEQLDPKKINVMRSYLSHKEVNKSELETSFFPSLSPLIEAWNKGMSYSDPQYESLVSLLLPSDRSAFEALGLSRKDLEIHLKNLEAEYRHQDERLLNYLAVQKESLRTVFCLTATAQVGKHYVMNKIGNGAIPADNGTPLWDSQFGSTLERLYYTTFLFSQTKISEDFIRKDLKSFVERYRKRITDEIADLSIENELDPNVITGDLVEAFEARYGKDFTLKRRDFNDAEIRHLTEWVNQKLERQIPLIRDYIFSQQEVYPKEIETTTHMFPLIAKQGVGLLGTTGTLFNRATYPHVFDNTHLSDTILRVIRRIQDSSSPITTTFTLTGDPQSDISAIFNTLPPNTTSPNSIIDTTGYFKKEFTEDYARLLLQIAHKNNPKVTAMVFYEGDILKVIKIGVEHASLYDGSLPRESVAAFWDVAHTTGSNILINLNSQSFLVLGKHIRLFELAQAAMRLRALGKGQGVTIAIPENDKIVMAEKLNKYLNVKVDKDLTVDQVFQYALLNEILEETGNNWRAIDMRMRLVVLEPIMKLLWNTSTPPEQATQIFNIAKVLFVNNRSQKPWDLYGSTIIKVPVSTGMQNLLTTWTNHPILHEIESNPRLFAYLNVEDLKKKFIEISQEDPGPLAPLVDSQTYLGQKKRTRELAKVKLKTQEVTKTHVKEKEQTKLFVKKRDLNLNSKPRSLQPLRRPPYSPLPIIPISHNLLSRNAYNPIPLKEAANMSFVDLQPSAMAGKNIGACISLNDFISLDPSLKTTLNIDRTNNDISLSLNLAPTWKSDSGVVPLFTPYYTFQKYASHALLIQDKATNAIRLQLIDANDAEAIAERLASQRNNPQAVSSAEVNLSLYHLTDNRVIASSPTPFNPENLPSVQKAMTKLIVQAKFISGITQYTKAEAEVLGPWLRVRKGDKILEKFISQIALMRERALEDFEKSSLGKMFQRYCNIPSSTIQDMLQQPQITHARNIHTLLFDRSLSPKEWLEEAHKLNEGMSTNTQTYAATWSDIAAPLLPVLYDLPNTNGAASRPKRGVFVSPSTQAINHNAVRRRWTMNTFFPTISDEYGAWRTAVPRMSGNQNRILPHTSGISAFWKGDQKIGNDADASYLMDAFNATKRNPTPTTATADQLELMSELAHPIWGLPTIANSNKVGEISSQANNALYYATQEPIYMVDQTIQTSTSDEQAGIDIANNALSHVDLVGSLRELSDQQSDYEFERLHGIFAFLSKQNINASARREYALKMLPRFFGSKFKEDMLFYTSFIPKQLTVATDQYSLNEITTLMDACYQQAKNSTNNWNGQSTEDDPATWERSLTLTQFAKQAPPSVAHITANWMNDQLKTTPQTHWWIDTMLYQMMFRNEPLINHRLYSSYFVQNAANHMHNAKYVGLITHINWNDLEILKKWQLSDFDLFADLAHFTTADKPAFTPYEMARKWATALEKASHSNNPSPQLWHAILGDISEAVTKNPPTNEADKEDLRKLLNVLDNFSIQLNDPEFEIIQTELGNIRLAANYSFDQDARKRSALEEIKKLPNYSEAQRRIQHFFIPNFLLVGREAEEVSSQELTSLLTDLHQVSSKGATFNNYQDWEHLFKNVIRRFSLNGTKAQQQTYRQWIDTALNRPNSEMSDSAVLISLDFFPKTVEHTKLVSYIKGREPDFIQKMIDHAGSSLSQIPSFRNDFILFAEISDLNTANRPLLTYDDYASRLTKAIKGHNLNIDSQITQVLKTIHDRAKSVSLNTRNKAVLIDLTNTIEIACAHLSNSQIDSSFLSAFNNLLRLSEFIYDPNSNIENASVEMFKSSISDFRKQALAKLIPVLRDETTDSSWKVPTLLKILESGKISGNQHWETLINLFLNHDRNALPNILAQVLPQAKSNLHVVHYLFRNIREYDFSQIDHQQYIKFLNTLDPNSNSFFKEILNGLGKANVDSAFAIAKNDYTLVCKLLDFKLNGTPPLTTQDLIDAANNYLSTLTSSTISNDPHLLYILRKLNQMDINTNKKAVSTLLEKIELNSPNLNNYLKDLIKEMHLQVDFTNNADENILKAIDEVIKQSGNLRAQLYEELIYEYFVRSINSKTFKAILDRADSRTHNELNQLVTTIINQYPGYNQAAIDWIHDKVVNQGKFSPMAKHLFAKISLNDFDYTAVEAIWKLTSNYERSSLFDSMLGQLSSWNPGISSNSKNLFGRDDFHLFATMANLPIQNIPELSLSERLKLLTPFIPLFNQARANVELDTACRLVNGALPISRWYSQSQISEEEAEEMVPFVKALKSTSNYRGLSGYISTFESYLQKT